jgi:hypothetical protein
VNITANLPNLPANCSVYQPGTNDRIYIGMDVGVYTRDNSSATWTLLNTALPNVAIFDMEISPAAPTLLRAATFGRGVYQTELIQPLTVPTSSFAAIGAICTGVSKTFTDLSSEAPNSWNWTVAPSTGVLISSTTDQNPLITFPSSGVYTITLIASNTFGAGSTDTKTITVANSPVLNLSTSVGTQTVCMNEDITLIAGGASTYTWLPGPSTGSSLPFNGTLGNDVTYTVTGRSTEGCVGTEEMTIVVSECTGIGKGTSGQDKFEVLQNLEAEIEIVDVSGKTVMKQKANFKKERSEQNIDISNLPAGVYLIHISSEQNSTQTIKLVKE